MKRNFTLFIIMFGFLLSRGQTESDRTDSLIYENTSVVNYATKFSDSPNTAIEDALIGRVAGLQIQKWSGSPGVQSILSIRNAGTIDKSAMPLVIVNGVPIFQTPSLFTNTDPLSAIPIEEIESVEILKDAGATALYGARGANGVICVTTKTGHDKDAVYVNFSGGVNFVGNNFESPLSGNSERYRIKSLYDKRNLLYPASKIGYPSVVSDSLNNFYRLSNDWQSKYFGIRPVKTSNITLSGSGNYGFYRLNVGVMNDQAVKKNNALNRYNVGLNTRYRITENFTFDFYLSAVLAQRERSLSNLFEPSYFPFDNDRNFFPALTFESDKGLLNDNSDKYILISSALNFMLTNNLKLRSRFGIVTDAVNSKMFIPSTLNNGVISAFAASEKKQRLSNKTVATWVNQFGKSKSTTDFGFEFIQTNSELIDIKGERAGSGFSDFVKTVGSAYSRTDVTGKSDSYSNVLMSLFANSKIDLTEKFQLLATLRVDGSSSYKVNRWGVFPAIGTHLNLINRPGGKALTQLNIKANVGRSGFFANPENRYLGAMVSQGSYTGNEAPVAVYPFNENVNYPKTTQYDFGAEMVFGYNTTLLVDWFNKKTSDYLYQVFMPTFSGYDYKYANGFNVTNSGIEVTFNAKINSGDFSWDMGINGSFIKSKVNAIPDNASNSTLEYLKKNDALTSIYAYESNGYYKNDGSDIKASDGFMNVAFQPGTPKIVDNNGDGMISASDMVVIADIQPDVFGGVSNLFTYRKLYLDTHFSFALGGEVVNESQTERFADNTYLHSLFKAENNSTNYYFIRNSVDRNNGLTIQGISSIQKISLLRLEKIALGYDLGSKKLMGLNLKETKIFLSVSNLFVLSNYSGDPQNTYNGIKQFDLASSGTPRYKTVILGLRIKL